MLSTQSLVGR